MIKITFPDNSRREYNAGVNGREIAESISPSLAREVLSITVNDEVWDTMRPINENANILLHKWADEDGKHAFWHSSAHLMAEAIEAIYPGTKFGIACRAWLPAKPGFAPQSETKVKKSGPEG